MALSGRARQLGCGLAATMILSIIASSVAPAPASADAGSNKQAQAAALAEQINADAVQVQVLDEQYDGAQYHLGQVAQQLSAAQHQTQVAEANAQRSRAALASEAVVAYMHGGTTTSPSMSSYSGSVDLSVQEGYFQLAVGSQADALDQYRSSEQLLTQQQAALRSAQSSDQTAAAAVKSNEQAVSAASASAQATLNQVKGQLVQLVAQQQAQIAAQQEAQVKAQLLAAQAKAAAAAPPPTSPSRAPSLAPQIAGGSRSTAPPTTRAPSSSSSAPVGPIPAPSAGAAAAIAYARAQIGKPYQWGGSGPNSFDCSGLTMMAWAAGGVSLPHYSAAQYADTAHIPIADLEPGDLVFFGSDIHHVGLYIGNGEMIDAPDTGAFVRVDSIYWSDLDPEGGRP